MTLGLKTKAFLVFFGWDKQKNGAACGLLKKGFPVAEPSMGVAACSAKFGDVNRRP